MCLWRFVSVHLCLLGLALERIRCGARFGNVYLLRFVALGAGGGAERAAAPVEVCSFKERRRGIIWLSRSVCSRCARRRRHIWTSARNNGNSALSQTFSQRWNGMFARCERHKKCADAGFFLHLLSPDCRDPASLFRKVFPLLAL